MKKRHLRDLYVRGVVHTVDDGEGGVEVYLKKLNLVESEDAIRRANAARAAILVAAEDRESDVFRATMGDVLDSSRENLVEYLIADPLSKKRESIEAEVGAAPEWSDDDRLQGLTDAWRDGLARKFEDDPDDPEAKPVFEALKKFADEVEGLLEGEANFLRRDYDAISDEELHEKVIKHFLKATADLKWVDAFRKAQLLHAVRDPENRNEKYFDTLQDVEELEAPVLLDLLRVYRDLDVDPQEGKDSPETPTS